MDTSVGSLYTSLASVALQFMHWLACNSFNLPLIIYQVEVKVEQLWSDDMDVTAVTSGENVKIKVTFTKDQNWIRPLNIKCFR